ncbi:Su(P) [Bugula neritina]|uniref:Prostaglandin E synthase 2 n=1 Tax=Bugula neritina TaxID=10212 RepID=A0A7J7J4G7_BUGNE|nr:Su(P) [Bugula neritina]
MAAPCGKRGNLSFINTNTNSNIFPSLQNCLQRVRYSSYSNTHNALEITKYKNNRFLKTLAIGSASIVGIVCGLKLKVKLSSTSTTNAAVSHPLSGADNNGSYQTFDKIECQNFKLSNAFKNLKLSSIWSMCANSMKSTSFQLPKLKVNAAAKENQLPVSANPSDFQSSGSLDKVPWHFHHPPTKKIRHGSTGGLAKLTLYQYVTCPFCCKVRAYLDFYGIDYDIIEVDSIRRTQKKWTSYKKVPVLVCDGAGPDGFLQLNDSSVIVSVLESHRLSSLQSKESTVTSPGLEKLVSYYPVLESKEGRKTVYEFPNKYFVMFGDGEIPKELSALREEREWREWVDNNLVHILSPNAYRTLSEAVQSFRWFSEVGDWETAMSSWSRLVCIYSGAFVMWAIGGRLKRKYGLEDDVRQSLYKAINDWLEGIGPDRKYMGGATPNLADLAVYGVMSSIEGCQAFKDLCDNTQFMNWYTPMKRSVQEHQGGISKQLREAK